MQNILITAVLAGLVSALVVTTGYHLLVAAPRLRNLATVTDTHDGLLGGGASRATDRLATLERDNAAVARAHPRAAHRHAGGPPRGRRKPRDRPARHARARQRRCRPRARRRGPPHRRAREGRPHRGPTSRLRALQLARRRRLRLVVRAGAEV